MQWASLHGHSWFSLLDGIADPVKIAKRAAKLGLSAVSLTDHGNIGGVVDFTEACKAEGVRGLLGSEFYLSRQDSRIRTPDNGRPYSHLVVLAKNRKGWQQLIRAVSAAHSQTRSYYHPRLSLDEFREFAGDLIAISGHPGSGMANVIWKNAKAAYGCRSKEMLRDHLVEDALGVAVREAEHYRDVFGAGNFFLEKQVLDPENMPAAKVIATAMERVSKRTGIPTVATADSHYVERADAYDQRVLLCSRLRTTIQQAMAKADGHEDMELGGFFRANCFHIPSIEEMAAHHDARSIEMAAEVAAMIEDFDIRGEPKLPKFPCPDGLDEKTYLRRLCEDGFDRLLTRRESSLLHGLDEYRARLDMELGVIEGANLSAYFLLIQECVRFGRDRGWLLGAARGSAAGCLLSYLIGVTLVDPLPYDLLFERFLNAGRLVPGKMTLPDVDLDFPVHKRDQVFRHLEGKFGVDCVAKVGTYNSLQGRSALDEVMAAHGVDFELRKQVTKAIPGKEKIAEELEAMREAGEEPSIIRFALETYADELADYARLEDDGSITGDMGPYFAQAIRVERVRKNTSIHAAGVIVASEPLADFLPVRYDDSLGANVTMVDGPSAEKLGGVKLDLLGVAMLNKGEGVRDLLLTGEMDESGYTR